MVLASTFYTKHLKTPNLGCVTSTTSAYQLPKHFFHEYPNFDQILYFMWLWHTRVWQGSFSCGFLIDNLSLTLNIPPTPPTFISNYTPYTTPTTLLYSTSPSWDDKASQSFFLQIVVFDHFAMSHTWVPLQRFSGKTFDNWVPGGPFLRQTDRQGPKAMLQLILNQRDIFYSFSLTWYSISVDFSLLVKLVKGVSYLVVHHV